MNWRLKLDWNLIRDISSKHGLNSYLVASIIGQESKGETYAIRFEPRFKYRQEPSRWASLLNITEETEKLLQACSIGIMQVMGCRARELGHKTSLLELTKPEVGIEIGCINLQRLFLRYTDTTDVIAAYNMGSALFEANGRYKNQDYVNKVMGYLGEFKKGEKNE